ncbi:MAG TPA: hypothetical protein PKE21_15465 [Flavobacteriales bacterium]|nr:hypothetical protein [Flavobacteriales bacterium]HMR28880.1 hypothetical protein [Flavobacteriales bacterium]
MTDTIKNTWDVLISVATLLGGVVAFMFSYRQWWRGQADLLAGVFAGTS